MDWADREKVKEQYSHDRHLHYHQEQFRAPKRSTLALAGFAKKIVGSPAAPYAAIDVGCGGGANIYHLSRVLPQTRWVGLDAVDKFFSLARQFLGETEQYRFVRGDLYRLGELFPGKSFDLSFSIQTLSWLPGYEEPLRQILDLTKRWIFVTSLFSHFKADASIQVYEYNDDWTVREDSPYNYNVYSYGRFREFCLGAGAKEVIAEDFHIDIELREPADGRMGTYTIKSRDEVNLQFSGPLFLPWKMIAIRME